MKQKFFSVIMVMVLLSLFFACSKKEAELEEVISFKSAESEQVSDSVTEYEAPAEEITAPAPVTDAVAVADTVVVADTTAPAEVLNLIASSGDRSVILNWTNPSDEDFAKVVITYGVDGTTVVRGIPGGSGKQYITDLTNGKEYTFTVMAVDRIGNVSDGVQVSSVPVTPEPVKIEAEPVKVAERAVEPVKVAENAPAAPVVEAPAEPVKIETELVKVAERAAEPVKVVENTPAAPVVEAPVVETASAETPASVEVVPAVLAASANTDAVTSEPETPAEPSVETPVQPISEPVIQPAAAPVVEAPVVETASAETPASVEVVPAVLAASANTDAVTSEPETPEAVVEVQPSVIPASAVETSAKVAMAPASAFTPEPEPIVEPVQTSVSVPVVQFIRNADGNIAYNFNTVFEKTGEVSVLAKVSSVELNGEKALMSAYRMSKYPVTQELFQAVMGINPSKCVDSSTIYKTAEGEVTKLKPCDKVSWYDAIAFCNKLSLCFEYEPCYVVNGVDDWASLVYENIPVEYNADWSDAYCDFTRNGFRLPTEREWEFAARGGNAEAAEWEYTFSGKDTSVREAVNADLDSVGWYRFNICNGGVSSAEEPAYGAGYGTHETGLKEPNSLSIYDMCGNVWEWCWDSYETTDDYSTFEVDPRQGVPADSCRALRGGSWGIDATCCDIPSRLVEYESYRSARYGFRLVRTAGAD